MTSAPRTTTSFDSAGTCTWIVVLENGQYVYDPTAKITVVDRSQAHVWIDEDGRRALTWATQANWVGAHARVVRASL